MSSCKLCSGYVPEPVPLLHLLTCIQTWGMTHATMTELNVLQLLQKNGFDAACTLYRVQTCKLRMSTYPPDELEACVSSPNVLVIAINHEGCPIKVVVCEEIQPMVGGRVPDIRGVQACAGW
jgi:hypothetical protein